MFICVCSAFKVWGTFVTALWTKTWEMNAENPIKTGYSLWKGLLCLQKRTRTIVQINIREASASTVKYMIWYLIPLLDSNLSHISVRSLRVPDVKPVSKSFTDDDCQIESHNRTMKNMSLASTVTVTNSPPKHYHCVWTLHITECIVLLGRFQMTSWKCHRWNAESPRKN